VKLLIQISATRLVLRKGTRRALPFSTKNHRVILLSDALKKLICTQGQEEVKKKYIFFLVSIYLKI
jgi:hypothetical protein